MNVENDDRKEREKKTEAENSFCGLFENARNSFIFLSQS